MKLPPAQNSIAVPLPALPVPVLPRQRPRLYGLRRTPPVRCLAWRRRGWLALTTLTKYRDRDARWWRLAAIQGFIICAAVLACILFLRIIALATPLVLLGLFSSLFAARAQRLNPQRAQTMLMQWDALYAADYSELWSSGLALLIMDDQSWQQLFEARLPGIVQTALQLPRTFDDRLIYAAAFWPVLTRLRDGQLSGLTPEMLSCVQTLRKLNAGPSGWQETDDLPLVARCAALFDFFYGDQE